MRLSGRIIGLLKEYMHDLVEQAKQEAAAHATFGFATHPYRADQAISDLLAILDDRIESEGVQVGLPVEFLHQMWTLCNTANAHITETVWLKKTSMKAMGPKPKCANRPIKRSSRFSNHSQKTITLKTPHQTEEQPSLP